MKKNAYRGHRFPPAIIQVTVWMHARFTLSLRDVEELLAERGLDISYETVRRWFLKVGQAYARRSFIIAMAGPMACQWCRRQKQRSRLD